MATSQNFIKKTNENGSTDHSDRYCHYVLFIQFCNHSFKDFIACVESLNNVISNDESLGDGFCIGHSYFCNLLPDTIDDQVLSGIVEYELIPLLKEYWFDEPTKVKDWSSNLRSAIK